MQNAECRMQNYWNCVGYNNAIANNKSIVVNAFMRSANFTIKKMRNLTLLLAGRYKLLQKLHYEVNSLTVRQT